MIPSRWNRAPRVTVGGWVLAVCLAAPGLQTPAASQAPAAPPPAAPARPSRHPLLDIGRALLRKGQLAEAERLFTAALGQETGQAAAGLAEVDLRKGRLQEAIRHAGMAAVQPGWRALGARLQAEALRRAGRWSEAVETLQDLHRAGDSDLRCRVELALLLRERGRAREATPLLDGVVRDYNSGKVDKKNAEELVDTARAAVGLGLWQDANETFQDALAVDPTCARANVEWGALFLAKYNADEALKCLGDALKLDRDDPDLIIARAQAMMARGAINPALRREIDRALKLNPGLLEAFTLQARIFLDEEDLGAAQKVLAEARKLNPESLETLSLLAAVAYLKDDPTGFEALKKEVLGLHPTCSTFFGEIGELVVRNRRYAEAVALFRQGAALDPTDSTVAAALGANLLRLGVAQEAEGLKLLRKAFEADGFNVRTYNTLQLYDEVFSKSYATFDAPPFRFRVPGKERPLLERYVPRLMQKAWEGYRAKYGFTPQNPVLVELFTQRQHYGARTLGLPEIGAQGTCFGELVTAMSPASAEASWEQVLWHELAHVFHLQLSKNRVARWFTEGLSEYETNIVRPHWKREHAEEIMDLLQDGKLLRIDQLSNGFSQPESPGGVAVAYQQSSLVIHYLAETFGFPRLVEALKLYGAGKPDSEVMRAITGKSLPELDAGFQTYLRRRYAHYLQGFRFDPDDFEDPEPFAKAAAASPKDAAVVARYAAALLVKRAPQVLEVARQALALDPKNALARYALGEALRGMGDRPAAAVELQTLIDQGSDGFPIRWSLGQMAIQAGDAAAAQKHMDAAKKWDPDAPDPYQALMQFYEARDGRAELLREAEALLEVEEHNHGVARLLFDRLALDRKWEDLARIAPRVLEITPMEPFIHQQYGLALAQLKRPAEAAFELESALAAGVRRPPTVRGLLARQYLDAGDRDRAKKTAEQTLKEDPRNVDAAEVMRRLAP